MRWSRLSIRRFTTHAALVSLGLTIALGVALPHPAHAASIVVTSFADTTNGDGLCTLREAISNANDNAATYSDCAPGNGADTITFGVGGIITLTSALPIITDPVGLAIDGTGQAVTVSGNNAVRVFNVQPTNQLELRRLTITQGNAPEGGAMRVNGKLTVIDSVISGNSSSGTGGAIAATDIAMVNSTVCDNSSSNRGGAIEANSVMITESTICRNTSALGGGAIYGGSVTIHNSTITDNRSTEPDYPGGAIVGQPLEITGSTISGNSTEGDGGAISRGRLTLANSHITGNRSQGRGGAISVGAGGAITDSFIGGNSAGGKGGGVRYNHNDDFDFTVTSSMFVANSASHGGGISNTGPLTIMDSHLRGNSATYVGGGIESTGLLTMVNSGISGNRASYAGGGIHNIGTLNLTSSELSENSSHGNGGGISNHGTTTVRSSTISGNSAGSTLLGCCGGGISNDGTLKLTNSTISGNRASFGGGGVRNSGLLSITNSTIAGNIAGDAGGGIHGPGATSVTNSVLANQGPAGSPDCFGTIAFLGPNLIRNPVDCTITGTPPTTGDPGLSPLAHNGGPTPTHALLLGSPALDAGDDAVCSAAPVSGRDQRGIARPQGAHCDLGAFERRPVEPALLPNGDFEAGATGWTLRGFVDGIARVEAEGSCFGANNTLGITFHGRHALNVRSNATGLLDSVGVATSTPFTLGTTITFRALAENDDAIPAADPVNFEVRILNAGGTLLAAHAVKPNILTTSPGTSTDGCLVGDARDGSWSTHVVDTVPWAGQLGRIEFRQHTNVPGKGFLTLIDDIVAVGE